MVYTFIYRRFVCKAHLKLCRVHVYIQHGAVHLKTQNTGREFPGHNGASVRLLQGRHARFGADIPSVYVEHLHRPVRLDGGNGLCYEAVNMYPSECIIHFDKAVEEAFIKSNL